MKVEGCCTEMMNNWMSNRKLINPVTVANI